MKKEKKNRKTKKFAPFLRRKLSNSTSSHPVQKYRPKHRFPEVPEPPLHPSFLRTKWHVQHRLSRENKLWIRLKKQQQLPGSECPVMRKV